MTELTINVNQDVLDWLTTRSINEQCSIEDFVLVILNAVAINSILNSKTLHHETLPQNAK